MTIFAKNQDHSMHVKAITRVIQRQPWSEAEKTHVQNLFQNTRHGQITGKQIDEVFQKLKTRPDHTLQSHHLKSFHDQLSHPFQQTMSAPTARVSTPRLKL